MNRREWAPRHPSPRIVVDPIVNRFPHFVAPLRCEDCSGRPASLPNERPAGTSQSRLTDLDVGRWAPDSAAVGNLFHQISPNSAPKPYPDLGSQLRRKSALLLRARLLMTFSWLRSFRIVDDNRRSFLKRDRPSLLVLVCNGMQLHPRCWRDWAVLPRLELDRDGNFAQLLERIRPEGHS